MICGKVHLYSSQLNRGKGIKETGRTGKDRR